MTLTPAKKSDIILTMLEVVRRADMSLHFGLEMNMSEARHGKALKGLLDRYFK